MTRKGRIGGGIALLALAMVAVLLLRAAWVGSVQIAVREGARRDAVGPGFDEAAALERLAEAVRVPTVSREGGPPEAETLGKLWALLGARYPRVFGRLEVETLGGSRLIVWPGSEASLAPMLWLAHVDVVPVSPGSASGWRHPPFAGVIEDGVLFGRGALDDKVGVVAMLEALETMLARGLERRRTLLVAFGHDEETGGTEGAARIAERIEARGFAPLAFVLDEGGAITRGMVPGIERPVALVGIAEKGRVVLELEARAEGGHASTPPEHTAVGRLARALTRLESNPFPLRLEGATREMLLALAPEMPLARRLPLANLWLLEPLVVRTLARTPQGRAQLHTTLAPTRLAAGVQENVLPQVARATLDLRLLPGDTPASAAARVRRVIADEKVSVRGEERGVSPSAVSDPRSPAFRAIARAVREIAGEQVLVAPYLVMAATDSRHYAELAPGRVYRFLPISVRPGDMARIHGTDERLPAGDLGRCVRFLVRLAELADELP